MLPLSLLQLLEKGFEIPLEKVRAIDDLELFADAPLNSDAEKVIAMYVCPRCDQLHSVLLADEEAFNFFVESSKELQFRITGWLVANVTAPVNFSLQDASDALEQELRDEAQKEADLRQLLEGMTEEEIIQMSAEEVAQIISEIIERIESDDSDDGSTITFIGIEI